MIALKLILLFGLLETSYGYLAIKNDLSIEVGNNAKPADSLHSALHHNERAQNQELEPVSKYSLRSMYEKAKSYIPSPSFFVPKMSYQNGTLSYAWGLLHMTGSLRRPTKAPTLDKKDLSDAIVFPTSNTNHHENSRDLKIHQESSTISNAINRLLPKPEFENTQNNQNRLNDSESEDYEDIVQKIIIHQEPDMNLVSSNNISPKTNINNASETISENSIKNKKINGIPSSHDINSQQHVDEFSQNYTTESEVQKTQNPSELISSIETLVTTEASQTKLEDSQSITNELDNISEPSNNQYLVDTIEQINIKPANFYPLRESDNEEQISENPEPRSKPEDAQNKDGILEKIVKNKNVNKPDLDFWRAENYLGKTIGRPLFNYLMEHDMM